MHKVWIYVWHGEKISNNLSSGLVNVLTEQNSRFCPIRSLSDALQKSCRIYIILVASCSVACPHTSKSSANSKEWIDGQFGLNLIPAKWLADIASCRAIDGSFIERTNRYGDKGQPCRIPQSLLNFANDWPLMTIEKVGDETPAWMRFIEWPHAAIYV
jgi:hypothetical protein